MTYAPQGGPRGLSTSGVTQLVPRHDLSRSFSAHFDFLLLVELSIFLISSFYITHIEHIRLLRDTSGTRKEHVRNMPRTRQEHVRNTSGTCLEHVRNMPRTQLELRYISAPSAMNTKMLSSCVNYTSHLKIFHCTHQINIYIYIYICLSDVCSEISLNVKCSSRTMITSLCSLLKVQKCNAVLAVF